MSQPHRAYHDIGGDSIHSLPLNTGSVLPPGWATLTDALRTALGTKYRLHEQRRKIEELGAAVYERVTYYEIRVLAMLEISIEKEFLTRDEVEARMRYIKIRSEQNET
ncbi:MAG: hypothetical protein VYA17_00015 [Pseudomonadota bacterium]|nr:hypothetical protein [Pseudomonadota bacterium]